MVKSTPPNRAYQRAVGITAGTICFIQGLLWLVGTIVGILYYTRAIDRIFNVTILEEIVLYFLNSKYENPSLYIYPKTFLIFIVVQLLFSIPWIFLSGDLIWSSLHNKWTRIQKVSLAWTITTLTIAVVDLILVALLLADVDAPRLPSDKSEDATLVVLLVAARGGLFWLLNALFAGMVAVFYTRTRREDAAPMRATFIDAFQAPPTTFGADNAAFAHAQPSPTLREAPPPADFLFGSRYVQRERSVPVSALGGSAGRDGRSKLVPLKMGEPFIPEPDYTPPNSPSPRVKSILRSKSNYEL